MRSDRNDRVSVKGLQRGLFVVCFLALLLAAGCGSEDRLLSGLREERDVSFGDEADRLATEGPGAGAPEDAGAAQGAGASGDSGAVQDTGTENETGAGQEAGPAVDSDIGQAAGGEIYVHVCGAVKDPGVYGLPAGSRFYEAVEAAGGFAEDACRDYLNMAAVLADGSRLEIPTVEEIREKEALEREQAKDGGEKTPAEEGYYTLAGEPGTADTGENETAGEAASAPEGLININTAGIEELCRLPGIGEGRAKAILEYRDKQGSFGKKEDIMQVSGIGEKMYARMEAYLTVD